VSLTTYAAAPPVSDLLLATGMRAADSALSGSELRKGGVIIEAADRPLLTPQQAQLGYYLERYSQTPETAAVSVRIVRGDTATVVKTAPQLVPFGAGGGITRGMVDLAGLPPGEYGFEVVVKGHDTTVTRRAPFRMGGLETVAMTAPVAPPDIFAQLSEAQLDTLYGPLVYLMTSDEMGIYSTLTVQGKRDSCADSGPSVIPRRLRPSTSCRSISTRGSRKPTGASARGERRRSLAGAPTAGGSSSSMGRRKK